MSPLTHCSLCPQSHRLFTWHLYSHTVPQASYSITDCFLCPLSLSQTASYAPLISNRLHPMPCFFLPDCALFPTSSQRLLPISTLSQSFTNGRFSITVCFPCPLSRRLFSRLSLSQTAPHVFLMSHRLHPMPCFVTNCATCPTPPSKTAPLAHSLTVCC